MTFEKYNANPENKNKGGKENGLERNFCKMRNNRGIKEGV